MENIIIPIDENGEPCFDEALQSFLNCGSCNCETCNDYDCPCNS